MRRGNGRSQGHASSTRQGDQSRDPNRFAESALRLLENARSYAGIIGLTIGGASLGALVGVFKYKRFDEPAAQMRSMDRLLDASSSLSAADTGTDGINNTDYPNYTGDQTQQLRSIRSSGNNNGNQNRLTTARLSSLIPERWSLIRNDPNICRLMIMLAQCAPYAPERYTEMGDEMQALLECMRNAVDVQSGSDPRDNFLDYHAYTHRKKVIASVKDLVKRAIESRNDPNSGIPLPPRSQGHTLRSYYNSPDPPVINVAAVKSAEYYFIGYACDFSKYVHHVYLENLDTRVTEVDTTVDGNDSVNENTDVGVESNESDSDNNRGDGNHQEIVADGVTSDTQHHEYNYDRDQPDANSLLLPHQT